MTAQEISNQLKEELNAVLKKYNAKIEADYVGSIGASPCVELVVPFTVDGINGVLSLGDVIAPSYRQT